MKTQILSCYWKNKSNKNGYVLNWALTNIHKEMDRDIVFIDTNVFVSENYFLEDNSIVSTQLLPRHFAWIKLPLHCKT